MSPRPAALAMSALAAAALPCLTACSLLSISTPDKPLPQREINARILTREFASSFLSQVELTADDIAMRSADPRMQLDALRWKVGVAKAGQHAAMQMAPMMALLDTWTFAEQMQQFFVAGAGGSLFGTHQARVRGVAEALALDARELAHGAIPPEELAQYQDFVTRYVAANPLADLAFVRASVVDQWVTETGQQTSLVLTVGSVAQSMSDVSERLRMLGERAPSQAVWEAQLALGEAGVGRDDVLAALERADRSLDRLSRLAESSPEHFRSGVADLRASVLVLANRFDTSWAYMSASFRAEREALVANLDQQREAAVAVLDAQRVALAEEARRTADQAIASGGGYLRSLVRDMVIYGSLFLALFLGLPFAAGYFIGRARTKPH